MSFKRTLIGTNCKDDKVLVIVSISSLATVPSFEAFVSLSVAGVVLLRSMASCLVLEGLDTGGLLARVELDLPLIAVFCGLGELAGPSLTGGVC